MRRFTLVAAAGLLLGLVAFKTEAQPAPRLYRIGVVTEAWAANHPTVLGLKSGLRELGLEEGRDVAFDVRFTQGKPRTRPRRPRHWWTTASTCCSLRELRQRSPQSPPQAKCQSCLRKSMIRSPQAL